MKTYLISLFVCLLSFTLNAEDITLSENQTSQLEELHLASEKIEPVNGNEALTQALTIETESRAIDSPEVLDCVANIFGYYPHQVVMPLSQGWSYVDGAKCHVGNYSSFYVLTIFEGVNRGSQMIATYSGDILSVMPFSVVTYSPQGVVYTHTYSNSELVTGINQVMYVF
ncbi:MAG: hypothetical protein LW832_07430 [Parachlamydia sp.]|jgi:hypothetical protein|nr:hypothetical protein [Parachlamydia sp.]